MSGKVKDLIERLVEAKRVIQLQRKEIERLNKLLNILEEHK